MCTISTQHENISDGGIFLFAKIEMKSILNKGNNLDGNDQSIH